MATAARSGRALSVRWSAVRRHSLGQARALENPRHGGLADADVVLRRQVGGDLGGGQVAALAQLDDELVAVGAGAGLRPAAPVGQEERAFGLLEEFGAQVAQGPGGIAESARGLVDGELVDEQRPQGLVAPVRGVFGGEEALGGVLHVYLPLSV